MLFIAIQMIPKAIFAINTYTISASAAQGGRISPSGAVTVNHGANQTFTITPDTGYHINDILVDGVSTDVVNSYTFTNVTANHTIEVRFSINVYMIRAMPLEPDPLRHGYVSPSGNVAVNYGANQTFTITPDPGYHIDRVFIDGIIPVETTNSYVFSADVLVNNAPVGTVESYTFINVTDHHTIYASFAINTGTITASAMRGGRISPSGAVIVNYGADQKFTIKSVLGYRITDVLVDGVPVGILIAYNPIFTGGCLRRSSAIMLNLLHHFCIGCLWECFE